MKSNISKQNRVRVGWLHIVAVLLLLLLSVLVVACSSGTQDPRAATDLAGPTVTVTLHIGNTGMQSPTPVLPPYQCGAWARNTSPSTNTNAVGVYAKFTQLVDGNPVGVYGASAVATILWPNGTSDNVVAITTSDGLAVFSVRIANKQFAVNKMTLVMVTFSKAGVPTCTVGEDRAAFFTIMSAAKPKPTPKH